MKIIADTHTHTIMSGHAHSTLLENLAVAKARGLKFLAVTDHTSAMLGSCAPPYFACLKATTPEIYEGVYLLRGCEANILDASGALDISDGLLARLEWVIASIHSIVTKPMSFEEHTELYINIAKNPHVDVIGHPGQVEFEFDYEKVIKELKHCGKIVEINSSSARTRPASIPNCITIAKLCAKHGVPVVVSSDAHFAGDVGGFDFALALLKEAEIPEELVLNANEKRFAKYMTARTGRKFVL